MGSMFLIFAILFLVQGCAWIPNVSKYPSGLKIARVDQYTLDKTCSHTSDKGYHVEHAIGCYDEENDTIYLLYNCDGAKALTHELGHREHVSDPEAAGMNW